MKCEICGKKVTDDDFLTENGAPVYYHHEDFDKGPIYEWTQYIHGVKWAKVFCSNQHSNDWYNMQQAVSELIGNNGEKLKDLIEKSKEV